MDYADDEVQDNETIQKKEKQIKQQKQIIEAIKQDNANLTDEINYI